MNSLEDARPIEGWGVYENVDDGCRHVAPIHGRRHLMSMGCWCLPNLDDEDRMIVVHHEGNQ